MSIRIRTAGDEQAGLSVPKALDISKVQLSYVFQRKNLSVPEWQTRNGKFGHGSHNYCLIDLRLGHTSCNHSNEKEALSGVGGAPGTIKLVI